MTKRKHQLLTESERDQILAIPTDRDHLARLYTFEPSDIEIIGARRERRNQLGVALQLALLRHPGITLAQLIQDRGAIPHDLAAFVAEQLGLHVTELANYAARDQTMTDHARELAARLGLRGPTRADIPFMVEAAARTAWATDKGMTIAMGVVTALREARILLPSISTIERASSAGRARARKQAAHALIADLSAEQVQALDQLFDAAGGMSHLALLKTIPVAAKPDHVRQILDRLRQVRKIDISPDVAGRIHADRFRQYVREGRASPAYMIERYIPSRRRATLVAFLLDLEERLTDSALEMADKLIGGIFTRAKNAQARSYAATSKNVARLMLIFRRTIDALTDAVDTGEDPMEVLDASVGWHTLLKARPEVATIAETANLDPLRVAADRYATLRKFAPDLLEALQFRAGKGSAKTIAAIEMLRDLNRSGKRDLPADAPMPFRKEWQKIVMGDDGKINRRLWEIATIAHLRNKLRSGDVWGERSTGYRQFDSYLLSEPKAKPIVSALGLPPTAGEWLEQRGRELDWRLKKFARSLKRDALEGVRYRDGRLQISPVRTIATPDAEALADGLVCISLPFRTSVRPSWLISLQRAPRTTSVTSRPAADQSPPK